MVSLACFCDDICGDIRQSMHRGVHSDARSGVHGDVRRDARGGVRRDARSGVHGDVSGVPYQTCTVSSSGKWASISARYGSYHVGSCKRSPSFSNGSSMSKPGASVANSNSTPAGSRK